MGRPAASGRAGSLRLDRPKERSEGQDYTFIPPVEETLLAEFFIFWGKIFFVAAITRVSGPVGKSGLFTSKNIIERG